MDFLDSLLRANTIDSVNYQYRVASIKALMDKHKSNRTIKKWIDNQKSFGDVNNLEKIFAADLSKTDSLMKYSYFRDYLVRISKYKLPMIEVNYGSSGAFYIDSRKRFDSILKDKRFNQTAKNFLLLDAFNGIGRNFKVDDKEEYFKKLQKNVTDRGAIIKLKETYNLDFSQNDIMLLTNRKNDTLTYAEMIEKNKGKLIYLDFWASWCAPCRRAMPESRKLKKSFSPEEVAFVYVAMNDIKDKWRQAIKTDSIGGGQHYFIENSNTSRKIEELGVKTIPHYIIYNTEGKIVNGFADRPGRGAKEQIIEELHRTKK